LSIGRIQKDQKEALLEYCGERHERRLKNLWYFPTDSDQEFMTDLFQTEERWVYHRIDNILGVTGTVFQDKSHIQDFLKNALNRPVIQEIYLNGIISNWDGSKIGCHYQESIESLQPKEDQVFVFHGFIDRLGVTHKLGTESPFFDESNLEFHFTDCGEYGIVLSKMLYDGKKSETVSKGSAAVHVLEVKFI
jgi:hypothetical protein